MWVCLLGKELAILTIYLPVLYHIAYVSHLIYYSKQLCKDMQRTIYDLIKTIKQVKYNAHHDIAI